MIICHDLKLIFVKTKKVAGTSFEIALSKYCNQHDIITPITEPDERTRAALGFQGPTNYAFHHRLKYMLSQHANRKISGRFLGHMSSEKICKNIGQPLFAAYTKVSIQRDPLDFLISQFYFKKNKKGAENATPFKTWLDANYKNVEENYRIAPTSGPYAVDAMLTYETLVDDISKTPFLPEDFISVFANLSAKGNIRDKKSRDVIQFFEAEGCKDYINKIRALKT